MQDDTPGIDAEVACIKRELTMRGKHYYRLQDDKQKRIAAREIETMRAVLKRLILIRRGEMFRRFGFVKADNSD